MQQEAPIIEEDYLSQQHLWLQLLEQDCTIIENAIIAEQLRIDRLALKYYDDKEYQIANLMVLKYPNSVSKINFIYKCILYNWFRPQVSSLLEYVYQEIVGLKEKNIEIKLSTLNFFLKSLELFEKNGKQFQNIQAHLMNENQSE